MPYECGIAPTGDAQHRFSVKFYLVAMLFILFDIEAIFLYPWAVVFKQLKMFGFLEMLTFVVLILAGFFFIWKKGVLDWAHTEPAPARPVPIRLDLTPAEIRQAGVDRQMIPEDLRDNPLASALDDVAATAKFEFDELTVEVEPANIVEALRPRQDTI